MSRMVNPILVRTNAISRNCKSRFCLVEGVVRVKRLITLVGILVCLYPCFSIGMAQVGQVDRGDGDIVKSQDVQKAMIGGGINPDNPSSLLRLLENDSVQRELVLSNAQKQAIRHFQQTKFNGIVGSTGLRNKTQEEIRQHFSSEKVQEYFAKEKALAEGVLGEILTPVQSQRLRQIVFQVDIYRLGLAESLTEGRLGERIGIVNNQKVSLVERTREIEAKARHEINRIRDTARNEVLEELSAEQRVKAQKLLGNYFEYEELAVSQQVANSFRKATIEKETKK